MSADERNDDFLSRWSRRKHAAARPDGRADIPDAGKSPEIADGSESEREAELRANREAAEAVDIEGLDEGSDFTVFMKDGVPALLRQQALRVLWRSNPALANLDGLVEYGEDYASKDLVMKTFQSAWQAGRGYLKEELETAGGQGDPDRQEPAEGPPVAEAETGDPATGSAIAADAGPSEPGATPTAAEEENPTSSETEPSPREGPPARASLRGRLMLQEKS